MAEPEGDKSDSKSGHRTAIIGAVGVIFAAIITGFFLLGSKKIEGHPTGSTSALTSSNGNNGGHATGSGNQNGNGSQSNATVIVNVPGAQPSPTVTPTPSSPVPSNTPVQPPNAAPAPTPPPSQTNPPVPEVRPEERSEVHRSSRHRENSDTQRSAHRGSRHPSTPAIANTIAVAAEPPQPNPPPPVRSELTPNEAATEIRQIRSRVRRDPGDREAAHHFLVLMSRAVNTADASTACGEDLRGTFERFTGACSFHDRTSINSALELLPRVSSLCNSNLTYIASRLRVCAQEAE